MINRTEIMCPNCDRVHDGFVRDGNGDLMTCPTCNGSGKGVLVPKAVLDTIQDAYDGVMYMPDDADAYWLARQLLDILEND
jgi:uncharacterized protein YbaR (Trm112 family)